MPVFKKLAKKISGPKKKEQEHLIIKLMKDEKFYGKELNILDVGCGKSIILINIKKSLKENLHKVNCFGIDGNPSPLRSSKELEIEIHQLDLEKDKFPFPDNFFSIIIVNQVFEHLKQIFWVMSEIHRVLQKKGILIIGVPNLASLHDRFALLAGIQPYTIKVVGPHVRGYTIKGLKEFVELDSFFTVSEVASAVLDFFPPILARKILFLFPSLGNFIFFKCRKTEKAGNFAEVLKTRRFETNYLPTEGIGKMLK